MQNNWKMKLVLFLTLLGSIGIIAIIPYEITMIVGDVPIPIPLMITINSAVQIGQLFLFVLIGVRLLRRTGLGAPKLEGLVYERTLPTFSTRWILITISVTFVLSCLIIFLDSFYFSPALGIDQMPIQVPTWWQGLLAILYGGITEELMVRLFGMTLIVWLLARITNKQGEEIPNSFFYIAIFLSSVLFGLGHLPAAWEIFGELTSVIVLRTVILNGLIGLWFGYLYWKKGLEYAIVAHMAADFFIHVVFMQLMS